MKNINGYSGLYGHPNLSQTVNDAMLRSEIEGGMWAFDPRQLGFGDSLEIDPNKVLQIGSSLLITTQNSKYRLERTMGLGDSRFLISGHPIYCPTPTECRVNGSTWGGSTIKVGWIGIGMRLEVHFPFTDKSITTSVINKVELL